MFKENKAHLQANIFDFALNLPAKMEAEIHGSEEWMFYTLIFSTINEEDFRCLYSENSSRPNAPINAMVTALFLQHRRGWTFDALMKNIRFDLLTKVALGLRTLDEMPFSYATIFNFLNRLHDHYEKTGDTLLERVFDRLTSAQLKELKLKTTVQRTDSFQAESNISSFSRLRLLVAMVLRVHRVLCASDQEKYADLFSRYIRKTSGNYIHGVEPGNLGQEFSSLGEVFHRIHTEIAPQYRDSTVMETFERMFAEQFIVVADTLTLREASEIPSGTLQSPDDTDATYRKKRGETYRGQVVSVVETAHPENPLQLITDVAVVANNIDDSTILTDRLEKLHEKTPDLEELHHDGAYGSEANDILCALLEIDQVQTAIRGRKPDGVPIEITRLETGEYCVSCPIQSATVEQTKKKWKAEFPLAVCAGCALASTCQLEKHIECRVYYFSEEDYLRKRRFTNIERVPEARRTLRANVEATMNEFVCKTKNGKLRVRGAFRAMVFAFSTAVAINFGRIYRYIRSNKRDLAQSFSLQSILRRIFLVRWNDPTKIHREHTTLHHFSFAGRVDGLVGSGGF